MITRTWDIAQLQYFPQLDNHEKVIFVVNWILSASQDGKTAQIADVTNLTLNPGGDFIPYDQLTKEKVLEWVQAEIGDFYIQQYYTEVDKKLQQMLQPQLVAEDLPWAPKGYVPIDLT